MKTGILFVCLGNICRSPAAEGVFLDLIKNENVENQFHVDSAGTGDWHIGELPDKRMRSAALRRGVELTSRARQISKEDFNKFEYILVMDDSNYKNVISLTNSNEHKQKVKMFTEFQQEFDSEIVPDPYFGGEEGFDSVLDLVTDCSKGLLKHILTFDDKKGIR